MIEECRWHSLRSSADEPINIYMPDQQDHSREVYIDPKEMMEDGHTGASPSERDDLFTAGKQTPEITSNDGSVIETLDTAFHGTPGWSEGENLSGSNRADYYEARSNGKSDAEEELDDLRERNKNESGKSNAE